MEACASGDYAATHHLLRNHDIVTAMSWILYYSLGLHCTAGFVDMLMYW